MPTTSISRCGGTAGQTFSQVVLSLASTWNLIAYWTLCDGAAPYADTSGYDPVTPATMDLQVNTTPMTYDYTPGPLAANDCGAVGFNQDGWVGTISPSEFLFANTTDHRFDGQPLSICTFVRMQSSVNSFYQGICGNMSMAAGSPDYQVGMGFVGFQPTRILRFWNGQHTSGGTQKYVETAAGLTANTWYFAAGTWDGATLTFYLNGDVVGTTADTGGSYSNNNGFYIGRMNLNGVYSSLYGQEAQTTVWRSALSPAAVGTLATAAGY